MTEAARLEVPIIAKDELSAVLAKLEGQLQRTSQTSTRTGQAIGQGVGAGAQRAASSSLALQQAQARLEAQQGNLAGAAERLRNALAQQTTETVQVINARRQLLMVDAQLATGQSGLARTLSQAGEAAKANLVGIIGPAALASAGLSTLISVAESFGEAFKFKAELDASRQSITTLLGTTRDSGVVFGEAAQFAQRYAFTQEEITQAVSASVPIMRLSKATTEETLGALARLAALNPAEGISGAAFALRELASGDITSLVERFNLSRDAAREMKDQIAAGGDAVAVLSAFLDQSGVSMDVLANRTQGAVGKMNELKQAQEELTLAQAEFAQGPGLTLLEGKIAAIRGSTRLLSGDFDLMGQSLQNNVVAFVANAGAAQQYVAALLAGKSAAEANFIAVEAQANATAFLTGVQRDGGGATFEFANATNQLTGAMSAESAAAAELTAQLQAQASALAEEITKKQESEAAAQRLAAVQTTLASLGNAVASGLQTAASAADFLATRYGFATGEALKLVQAQAALANTTAKVPMAGIVEDRLTRDTPADRAQVKANQALEANRKLLADIAKAEKPKKARGGGGAPKLTAQQKLENQLLTSQEQYQQKSEDAERTHQQRILDIQADFAKKMMDAQESFTQSQLEGRAGFYDSLGDIEDQGLRQALAAQYEAAFQEADQIAQEKGADVGEKFLEARQAAIQAQAQRASEIQQAQDSGDQGKAEYLRGVDKLYREAEERKIQRIKEGQDSLASERDAALAEEGAKYEEAQDKLALSSERSADRAVTAAERRGMAVDGELAKVNALATAYGALGAPVGGTQAGGAAVSATTPTSPAVSLPTAAAKEGDPLVGALNAAQTAIVAAVAAVERATRDTTSAVKGLGGRLVT